MVFHKYLQRNIKISGRRESAPVFLSARNATPAQVSVAALLAAAHTLALSHSPPAPQPLPRPQRALRCHGVPQVPGQHGTFRFPTQAAGFPPSQRRSRSCHRYCQRQQPAWPAAALPARVLMNSQTPEVRRGHRLTKGQSKHLLRSSPALKILTSCFGADSRAP